MPDPYPSPVAWHEGLDAGDLGDPARLGLIRTAPPVVLTTGVVETTGFVAFREGHYRRLVAVCDSLGLACPWSEDAAFHAAVAAWCKALEHAPQVLRVSLVPQLAKCHGEAPCPVMVVPEFRPMPLQRRPYRLQTVCFDRTFPAFKHLVDGADPALLATLAAQGASDYLRVNTQGHVAEAAYANVFWWIPGEGLFTPHLAAGCVAGLMREAVIKVAHRQGIPIQEGLFPLAHLQDAQGLFLTNAVRGIFLVDALIGPETRLEKTFTNDEAFRRLLQPLCAAGPVYGEAVLL